MKTIVKQLSMAILFALSTNLHAQEFKTALGIGLDRGQAGDRIGPSIKHFFNTKSAIQGDVLFGEESTLIQAFYQHHFAAKKDASLKLFLGAGPGIQFYNYGSTFMIKPLAGFQYSFKSTPLSISFDWRPTLLLFDNDTEILPHQTGIGVRYTF